VSFLYTLYRVLMAALFVSGVAAHMINSNQGGKWFIYMTDQAPFL
jgi:hypothetical protein